MPPDRVFPFYSFSIAFRVVAVVAAAAAAAAVAEFRFLSIAFVCVCLCGRGKEEKGLWGERRKQSGRENNRIWTDHSPLLGSRGHVAQLHGDAPQGPSSRSQCHR